MSGAGGGLRLGPAARGLRLVRAGGFDCGEAVGIGPRLGVLHTLWGAEAFWEFWGEACQGNKTWRNLGKPQVALSQSEEAPAHSTVNAGQKPLEPKQKPARPPART